MREDLSRFALQVVGGVFFIGLLLGAGGTWLATRPAPDSALAEATTRVEQADSARAAIAHEVDSVARVTDTVRVLQRAAAARVIVLDERTLGIQATPGGPHVPTPIPPQVVEAIRRDRQLIVQLEAENARRLRQHVADSVAIAERDVKIAILEAQRAARCGAKCGVALGAGLTLTLLAAMAGLRGG